MQRLTTNTIRYPADGYNQFYVRDLYKPQVDVITPLKNEIFVRNNINDELKINFTVSFFDNSREMSSLVQLFGPDFNCLHRFFDIRNGIMQLSFDAKTGELYDAGGQALCESSQNFPVTNGKYGGWFNTRDSVYRGGQGRFEFSILSE